MPHIRSYFNQFYKKSDLLLLIENAELVNFPADDTQLMQNEKNFMNLFEL